MREILFRGKQKDNGEWLYGSLMQITYKEENNAMPFHMIFEDKFSFVGGDAKSLSHAIVDPETVGQYTGLIDKDGKRIFEGDLCDMSILGKDHTLQKIVIRYGAFGFEPVHPNKVHPEDRGWQSFWRNEHQDMWFPDFFTVIGNIHDNPELLGGDNA